MWRPHKYYYMHLTNEKVKHGGFVHACTQLSVLVRNAIKIGWLMVPQQRFLNESYKYLAPSKIYYNLGTYYLHKTYLTAVKALTRFYG